ncbi:L-asparaginase/N4-(beta-N-acetylglucosaminyl)-L-asparaginase [Pontibacter ummariensis]|uniref:Asparaginase n=1 Tax=Pontibacter ummariensis TaxID=1610492 RepID=A0A239G3Y5_9BACT|nr:N(4)-(beta-N-acetylglucosaminyl)-L-asparaginase [Pontibacter ummariensis]PRY11676.1 L-asparaginase/N4-(beta-N-acetylglucosaminyl)-L-asparaginase [Pontibacter ummariensis]SNS63143.1 asparaginase [Pontibacter ummariensis]
MNSRRNFLKVSALGTTLLTGLYPIEKAFAGVLGKGAGNKPVVISTWNHGMPANEAAWKILSQGGQALDAVEAGVRVPEGDPNVRTVGYGGYPDREGKVTLDACIMDKDSNCGAVAFLQHIKHPISVARKVMEDTPHVMLVGEGALQFALSKGFPKENLLTPESERDWKEWLKQSQYKPVVNIENHDTIGLLALDAHGNLAGACTTSGASYKMHGRVGDSPIIGAGLFVDNEVGAATATGLGEAVIRMVGSHLVVELMRQGNSPEKACRLAVERIISKQKNVKDLQVGFIALNKQGEYGGYCIQKGFNYAVLDQTTKKLIDAKSKL